MFRSFASPGFLGHLHFIRMGAAVPAAAFHGLAELGIDRFGFSAPAALGGGNFWAPEISEFKGRYAVYFVGRKRDGQLTVAVATADQPGGPYLDRGPLVSQADGSIDPAPAMDENGVRYLIWKEDGNSRGQPTPIWAQPLNDDGTKLMGEPRELIRNDVAWEGGVVEGPFILRHNGWF